MMYKKLYFLLLSLLLVFSCTAQQTDVDRAFRHAEKQTGIMLNAVEKEKKEGDGKGISPRNLEPSGKLRLVHSGDWTSGFFPGVLWYLYEYNRDSVWLKNAETFTAGIEKEKWNAGTHDMGFKVYCSFGNGYRLTKNRDYRDVIVQSAKTLIKRFNPAVGAIRSWDHNKDKWKFPVIIDNMMNLELLFAATEITGDSVFYEVAVSHANTTLKNHFRKDNSSYHVIGYDPVTGAVEKRNTHQGYSDGSAWARGQAWGLYGYSMCYRETGNKEYLQQADKIAACILNHPNMPADLVPYWDFDAPEIPNEERDVSAAAVIASALYELSTFSKAGKKYRSAADKIIKSLSTVYTAPEGGAQGFILLHSVGSKPSGSEVDVPLVYADYYYLEALLRKKHLEGK
ncbi:glycoside hydrolase family 88 protein [Sinomicrobium weinanense]|uniref:Glycoside hydrolase family 88 protein n=1 Tax=Sinomicrobium weinanense TaxID=2842200 RepID=A0A926Q4S5_9FLAO|nr:glycoside hydrolase family 88 protein [Sinomicrobium weinanense]MBC9797200.1 glycoside hydrolase family 88 protein [Sinomicrobium weinanense]MBU3122736.1 glycoside hydrolase family 88 protein [Sinomicrobium weinanense]